jgi:hypothetical protein
MSAASLMDKLVKSGAVGTHDGMPTFKRAFADYLVWTLGKREMLDTTLGDWRAILAAFDPSLQKLSNDEIMDIVLLFVYHLKHLQTPTIRK